MPRHLYRSLLLSCGFYFAATSYVVATPIGVDEILYQGGENPTVLNGSVDMSVAGNLLTVVLTNTSTADAGSGGAGNLLAGLGFNLPAGVSIGSGSASMVGSTAIGFTAPVDNNVGSEWGFNNGIPGSGHFDAPGDGPATLLVNTVISSQNNDGPNQFLPGSISNPAHLGGPDFGAASASAPIGGQEGILDHVTFSLTLNGTVPASLLDDIEASPVVLAFGSPANSILVPEPRPILLLTAIFALILVARRH